MTPLSLVHRPTPIERLVWHGAENPFADLDVWIKRDDMTGGPEAGNKIRKLEFLLAHAKERNATHVITCGGIQSNHCRATALLAARLGLSCVLLLRVDEGDTSPDTPAPKAKLPRSGNVLLDRLAGAEIRFVSHAEYKERDACMATVARSIEARGGRPYVIPEGGSNGIGSLGYVRAMQEIRAQLDLGLGGGKMFDVIVQACGSGGTAAGVAMGGASVSTRVLAVCVCDDAKYFRGVVERIVREAPSEAKENGVLPIDFDEWSRGPRYGVMDEEQRQLVVRTARATGLILDPVYTGKAWQAMTRVPKGLRVLFLHTGGLPGMLAAGDTFEREL